MGSKYQIILCLLVVCNLIHSIKTETRKSFGSCITPSSENGICMSLKDCKQIFELVNNPRNNNKDFLRKSQCGIDSTQSDPSKLVLVCCPNDFEDRILSNDAEIIPSNVLPKPGVCGQILGNKIYGGVKTEITEFPWMVLIKYLKPRNQISFECGGSLINNQYVLTAAHCVKSKNVPKVWKITHVRLGEYDLNTAPDCVEKANGQLDCAPLHKDIPVDKVIVHEGYIPGTTEQFNDIALIRMKERVEFNTFINPICLPISEELRAKNFKDTLMEIAGWGATKTSNFSNIKMKAAVTGWALHNCQQSFAQYLIPISDSQICAGGEESIDTCRGDSGGPLMALEDVGHLQTYFAAGVVSYGPKPCGAIDWPGVYTRVGHFIPWIQSHLEP